ncbi:MAG: hypothetical protein H5T73_09750 [Actinobacteria bacterium]|nr:hypothetical protein [Actinomycetota bacterium]
MGGKKLVRIVGDITIDWQILRPGGAKTKGVDIVHRWGLSNCQAAAQAGGAALLADLLLKMKELSGDTSREISRPHFNRKALREPGSTGVARTYMTWKPFPAEAGNSGEYAWRISDFLGEDRPRPSGAARTRAAENGPDDQGVPDILVIEDTNLGFRSDKASWPSFLAGGGAATGMPAHIFIKTADPLNGNDLLKTLCEQHADRLTVFTSVSDLRKSGCQIGYAISWEQVYEEIVNAVAAHEQLNQAKRVAVSLGASGAVLLTRGDGGGRESWLVFDPKNQEGDWEKKHPGDMVGYGTCIAAALIWEIAGGGGAQRMMDALKRGCSASRTLHRMGYENGARFPALRLRFPFKTVAGAILKGPAAAFTDVQLAFDTGERQNILNVKLAGEDKLKKAMEIISIGPERSLTEIPLERIGQWSSVDRVEIESMRSISNIVAEYVNRYRAGARLEKPLSLAVFGPPGSGKSFAIKQMARSLYPDLIEDREFNLSQFSSANELPAAFHKVRDMVLEQYLPLVFWDEFDTPLAGQELGWLKHFLAPMQDGRFREGGVFHPIGPAIFIFAGSQYATVEEFKQGKVDNREAERIAKKEDFLSRLKGFVNILGPNRLESEDYVDENFILRRAFLLRTILARKAPRLIDDSGNASINPGVLHAFLRVNRYFYGARSMEALVEMSSLSGKRSFELSSLPARQQLAMHVDADDFLRHACTP